MTGAAAPSDLYQRFRTLHASGCFVMPNPWDVGSARLLVRLGFPALATTSSGWAWAHGRPDNGLTVEAALDHLREIAAHVPVPVNGDFEGGFAIEPEGVAALAAGLDARLSEADTRLDSDYPGARTGRQPVHSVYVPADRVHAGLAADWGHQALAALDEHAPERPTWPQPPG